MSIISSRFRWQWVGIAQKTQKRRLRLSVVLQGPKWANCRRFPWKAFTAEGARKNPVVLHSEEFQETVRMKLPASFTIDEMPGGGHLETPFGTFTCSYIAKGEDLAFTRKLEVKGGTVPVEQYGALKALRGP